MKIAGFLLLLFMYSWTSAAQEIPAIKEPSSDFLIQRLEIRPSLTNLAPEVPNAGRFRIRTVNFDKSLDRKEVNMLAVIEQQEQMKRRNIELAPPVFVPQVQANLSASRDDNFSMTPRFYNQSFSPEFQTRGTRNSVYRNAAEGTGAQFLNSYNPFYRTRGYSPGYGYYYY